MKLSFVFDKCNYGGTETATKNKMDFLCALGVHCQIIFIHKGCEDEMFAGLAHFVAETDERLYRLVQDSNVVICLSNSYYIFDKLKKMGKPILVESHFGECRHLKNHLRNPGINAVIFPSNARRVEALPFIPNNIPAFVLPNCLGKDFLESLKCTSDSTPREKKTILWVGRISSKKNWMILPRLVENLKEGYQLRIVVGTDDSSDYINFLEIVQKMAQTDKIQICPNTPYNKMADFYREAASSGCYLSSSYTESFGMTALEAMASGCPMVLSDIPAFREITQENALFFSPDDINACLQAIYKICEEQNFRKTLSEALHQCYVRNYNPLDICYKYRTLIKNIFHVY